MKSALYTRYPWTSILIYNGLTVLHFWLGGAGLILGYGRWWGILIGAAYLVFAFIEMYLLMPLKVCPNCPYYRLGNSLCISGLNVVSRKLTKEGKVQEFSQRAKGVLCPNNLYIASLALPIVLLIPALAINFSFLALGIFIVLIGLLAFRFFVIFPKVACGHCRAKNVCPNAQAIGLK
jgi:hypothetical protein